MPASESKIIVKLEAEVGKLTTELNKAQKKISGFEKQSTKSAAAVSATFSRLDTALKAAISVYSLRQAAQLSDTYTEINSRLRLVTGSVDEFAAAQQGVFSIAQRTRQSFAVTAELYQRLAQSTDGLGISQQRLLQITETVNKAITISGASSQAAQAAIVQLGQGLSAGALRGEEFNSVVEQTPRLAKALADGLGVNIGKLREMAKEGQLTADVVIAALEGQAAAIQTEFGSVGATVGQAMQTLENSFVAIIGGAADASGAQRGVTEAILEFSETLNDPAIVSGANALAVGVIDAFKSITKVITETVNITKYFAESLAASIEGPAADDIVRIEDRLKNFQNLRGANWFSRVVDGFDDKELDKEIEYLTRLRDAYYEAATAKSGLPGSSAMLSGPPRRYSPGAGNEAQRILERQAAAEAAAKSAAAATKEQERAAKQLQSTFENTLDQYQREIALGKDATEVDRIRYEIANGGLKGLEASLQRRLIGLASEKARIAELVKMEEERAKLQQEVGSLTASLRTEEEVALDNYIESQNTLNKALAAGIPILGGYEEASRRTFERYQEDLTQAGEQTKELSVFAEQAARNMQDAFADFLFDPFEDGLDGMFNNFVNILRRMAAEAAAAAIFDAAKKWGKENSGTDGITGLIATGISLFGGARATGGPVDAGRAYMVGERGPEMFVPDVAGRIEPNVGRESALVVNNNFDMRGMTERDVKTAAGHIQRSVARSLSSARRYE